MCSVYRSDSVLQVLRMGQNGIKSLSLKAVHIVSLVCPDPNTIVLYYLLVFGALCFFFLLCAPPGKLLLLFGASRTEFLFLRLILNYWEFSQIFLFIFNSSMKELKTKEGYRFFYLVLAMCSVWKLLQETVHHELLAKWSLNKSLSLVICIGREK